MTVRPDVRLAVIGPSFFSYVSAVVGEFERRGIPTVEFDERPSNRPFDKVIFRLGLGWLRSEQRRAHLAAIMAGIVAHQATDVLLISVEVIDVAFVRELQQRGIRVHLYLWDGVANKKGIERLLAIVPNRGTFDPIDARRLGLPYIPLFAETTFYADEHGPAEPYLYDIGFCGTMHSSRFAIFARLLHAPWAGRLRLKLMLYNQSRLLMVIRGLANRHVWSVRPHVSTAPFPKAEVAKMLRDSRFVLDIPHPGQSGMTARTFEVMLAGTRLLTFNRTATETLPTSLQERILVIQAIDDIAAIDLDSFRRPPPLSSDDRYFVSLARFVDQLVDLMGLERKDSPARAIA